MSYPGVVLVGFALALLTGCASAPSAPSADRPCEVNFKVDSSQLLMRSYTTSQDFPTVPKAEMVDRITRNLNRKGYTILSVNRDAGTINAQQGVVGSGRTFPINGTVSPVGAGSKAELVVVLRGGMMTSTDNIRGEFCKLLEP